MIWINGRLFRQGSAKISALDGSFLWGVGLFETLAAHRGRVLFFDGHLARLRRSARFLKLRVPLSNSAIKRAVVRTLRANRLTEATIRITLSEDNLVIWVRRFEPYPKRIYREGGRLILIKSVPNDPLPLAGIKSTNYLAKMLGRREVRERRADEGVLLNAAGRPVEGTSSNLFIVSHGTILTPPLSEGLMPGVRRQVVLKLSHRLKIPLRERRLTVADLRRADEIFVTSTLKGVMPIGWFEGKRLHRPAPGPVTRRLNSLLESSRS